MQSNKEPIAELSRVSGVWRTIKQRMESRAESDRLSGLITRAEDMKSCILMQSRVNDKCESIFLGISTRV